MVAKDHSRNEFASKQIVQKSIPKTGGYLSQLHHCRGHIRKNWRSFYQRALSEWEGYHYMLSKKMI